MMKRNAYFAVDFTQMPFIMSIVVTAASPDCGLEGVTLS